ncbi:MAG: hypothetical protein R2713_11100 [Ilumatobacteraceae bacterium]
MWGAADPVFDDSFALDLATRLPHADQHRLAPGGPPVAARDRGGRRGRGDRHLAGRPDRRGASDAVSAGGAVAEASLARPPVWAALAARAADDAVAFVDGATGDTHSFRTLHER